MSWRVMLSLAIGSLQHCNHSNSLCHHINIYVTLYNQAVHQSKWLWKIGCKHNSLDTRTIPSYRKRDVILQRLIKSRSRHVCDNYFKLESVFFRLDFESIIKTCFLTIKHIFFRSGETNNHQQIHMVAGYPSSNIVVCSLLQYLKVFLAWTTYRIPNSKRPWRSEN